MKAVFDKNLAFALNAANSLLELDRPKNYDNDPNHYQIKPTEDIQLNRFDVSYGGEQQVEAIVRKTLGPSDIRVHSSAGNTRPRVWPMKTAPAGERYGEVPGYYFERRRATIPAVSSAAAPAAYAGRPRERPRARGRPAARVPLPRRPLAIGPDQEARPDRRRRGLQGRLAERTRPATTRRRATEHLQDGARGPRLRGLHVRRRQPAGQQRHAQRRRVPADQVPDQPRRALALRRGRLRVRRRLHPAGHHQHESEAHEQRDDADRSKEMAPGSTTRCWSCATTPTRAASSSSPAATSIRPRRRPHRTCRRPVRTRGRRTSSSGSTTRTNNGGDDDLPGTAFQRSRPIVQRHVAELPGRDRSPGGSAWRRPRRPRRSTDRAEGRRPVRRHGEHHRRFRRPATIPTRTPTARRYRGQDRRSACATGRANGATNEPLRAERSRPTSSPSRRRTPPVARSSRRATG